MYPNVRFWLRPVVAVFLAVGLAWPALAGWVTLKNDSTRVLVVQETVVAKDGAIKRGRPTRLLPGETLREFQAGPMVKRIEVYDMTAPGKILFAGKLNWQNDNQIFSLSSDGKVAAVVPIASRDIVPVRLIKPSSK